MDIVIHVRGESSKQLERLAREELRTPRDQAQKLFEDGLKEEVRRRAQNSEGCDVDECECAKCVDPIGYARWRRDHPRRYEGWLEQQRLHPTQHCDCPGCD